MQTSLRSGKRMVTKNSAVWLAFRRKTLHLVVPASVAYRLSKGPTLRQSNAPTVAAWAVPVAIKYLRLSGSVSAISTADSVHDVIYEDQKKEFW